MNTNHDLPPPPHADMYRENDRRVMTAGGQQPVSAVPPRPAESRARHDFKNQLGIILGFSELLLENMRDDDPRKPDVAEIRTATLNALQLVRVL